MRANPAKPEAFELMMQGSQALTDVEENGMRIDVPYLDRMIKGTSHKIKELEHQLKEDEVYREWRKIYGSKSDLGKREQLANVVFNVLGAESTQTTKGGKPKTSEEALESIDVPFVKRWINLEKLKKIRSTSLLGIRREVCDGFLRPVFNLHFAVTYRSSVRDPNSQNIPIRDQRLAKIVRRAFIPRSEDYALLEVDYGALEFRGAACFWRDEEMVAYASDDSLDIHRDMAAECYKLKVNDVSKKARTHAKNSFVFPILYGSWYRNCATNLWAQIGRQNIETQDGVDLYTHLARKGIESYEQFELHIKKVEEHFNKRFSHWSNEKEVWWSKYLKRGWFPMMTGFVCTGIYQRNDLMNYPIQGPSFHCLLWSLIQLNDWLKRNGMKSCIIGQIHDSIIMDVHRSEFDDVLAMCNYIMTKRIREEWNWIIVPLEIEAEAADTNWFEKQEVPIPA